MATASVTITFVDGTTIEAGEFNTNFDDLVTFLNSNVLHKDGAVAATGELDMGTNKIVNLAEPTADNDAARKVDIDLAAAGVHDHAASGVTSGTFDTDRIPDLDAGKITSGTFGSARIPSLAASKVTSGTFAVARLPVGTTASEVAAGNHTHSAYLAAAGDGFTGNLWTQSSSTSMATTSERVVITTSGAIITVRDSDVPLLVGRNSDGPAIQVYRSGSLTGGIGTTTGAFSFYDPSGNRAFAIINGGSSSSVYIRDGLSDVGNVETLRANRGTGSGFVPIGYYSSWMTDPLTGAKAKQDIVDLEDSPRFPGIDIIDQLSPADFERVSTGQREWGVILDQYKELGEDLRYLTTQGDEWGNAPDEMAHISLLLLAVKDLRSRLAAVEAA